MAAWLATRGHLVNRKRVQRLMGLVAICQLPNTSKAGAAHKVYPYMLGGLASRSSAANAHGCIMVRIRTESTEYKCVARYSAPTGELPSET